MKKTNRILSMILGVAIIFGASSCKDDDPIIPGGEGIPVADGFYITQSGVDPVSTSVLDAATVDAPDFKAMAREGFIQGYVYLTAGSYNIVEVTSKEITKTYGGPLEEVTTVHNEECDVSGYSLVTATLDGDAFTVSTDGLYVVTYDATLEEIILDQIETAGIIGAATPGGWGADSEMNTSASITADGASWTLEGVTLDVGEMKFRYNCRWAIDRRLDKNEPFDNANGYSLFTNYGGSIDNLLPGNEGANISVTEYAVYTVTFDWDPADGVSATLTKTGEAAPKAQYPDVMYLVGAGTAYGWDTPSTAANAEMHKIAGGAPNEGIYWKIAHLEAGQGFKLSEANWGTVNLGFTDVDEYDASGVTVSDNGGNMDIATSGMYMIVLNLQNDLAKVSIVAPEVYGMGDAFGGWTEDVAGNLYTIDNVAKTLISPATAASATAVRSYAQHPWISDWWNAEFVVVSGAIEYRNDSESDPTAVAVTAGQVITFHFDDNTGSIQ